MTEIDRISYIFGSFSRRRNSPEMTSAKRRSIAQIHQKFSQSKSNHQRVSSPKTVSEETSSGTCSVEKSQKFSDDDRLICKICNGKFVEPKVLPCLHTFCARCIKELIVNQLTSWNKEYDVPVRSKIKSSVSESSTGSEYESELRNASISSNGSWTPQTTGSSKSSQQEASEGRIQELNILTCPTCKTQHRLPQDSVNCLPPNYLVQNLLHRQIYEDPYSIRILCDLCTFDVSATAQCKSCSKNMCALCTEAHKRQRHTTRHVVSPIDTTKPKAGGQFCPLHPDQELHLFCINCRQIACQTCCVDVHNGHDCEIVSSLTKTYIKNIRDALNRAKPAAEQASSAIDQLDTLTQRIKKRSSIVQKEVEHFVETYKRTVEEHKNTLLLQVTKSREDRLLVVNAQKTNLENRVQEANNAIKFAEDLLANGSDVELMSFVGPLLDKLDWCSEVARHTEPRVTDCIQFLPEEKSSVTIKGTPVMYGVISTQTVVPQNCVLSAPDGLQDLRVHRKSELLIETRDVDNRSLCHGGETVTAELRYKDAGLRAVQVTVTDLRDGTYSLTFVPESAGQLCLSVYVRGKHIKNSPFTVAVRTVRPHHGTFHCCSFCSSGGSKQAACGCGGLMPGGYRGCGHGHDGHPGKRHWSCCGSLYEHSECTAAVSLSHYQFTL